MYPFLLSVAFAGELLLPRWESARTVKIDLFYFAPGISPLGSDYAPPLMVQWTAVLRCSAAAARTETCSFVDGLWWSFVREGSQVVESRNLPAPGTLEFVWTERGRLSSWDVQGDREAFWDLVGNAMLEAGWRRPDRLLPAGRRREFGSRVEGGVTRAIGGALEWELPKDGEGTTWAPSQTPTFARQYLQSTSKGTLSTTAVGGELTVTGTVSEYVKDGSVGALSLETEVKGVATFDRAVGRITTGRYETHITSTPAYGPTRSMVLVAPWSDGDSKEPLLMPDPWFGD